MAVRRKPMSEINVVPYIDVMLVLLVIFMATAPLFTQGVEVDLPQAPSEPLPDDDTDPLVVSVKRDGAIFLNIGIRRTTRRAAASRSSRWRTRRRASSARVPRCPSTSGPTAKSSTARWSRS